MKRYQNPDVFEPLALAYAMGTLQGAARRRFESLLEQHFYLRAVTHAYQSQLTALDKLTPEETPPARVWKNISQQLQLPKTAPSTQRWHKLWTYLPWSLAVVTSVVAAVLVTLLLNIQPNSEMYIATMTPPSVSNRFAVVAVNRKALEVSFTLPSTAPPATKEADVMPTLWCYHKDKTRPPMKMGTLTMAEKNYMPVTPRMLKELETVSDFVISLEPMDQKSKTPLGQVAYQGALIRL